MPKIIFNFILNNPLDTEIEIDKYKQIPTFWNLKSLLMIEELKKLNGAKDDIRYIYKSYQMPSS
jgi:hypothetical protein